MANTSAKYTDEYRRETADYIISTGRPIAQVAAKLGIDQKTASRWVKDRHDALGRSIPASEESAEMRALRKRNRELEMKNAFLKKTAAFFAKEQE